MQRLVALGCAFVQPAAGFIAFCGTFGKLALEISNDLLEIGTTSPIPGINLPNPKML